MISYFVVGQIEVNVGQFCFQPFLGWSFVLRVIGGSAFLLTFVEDAFVEVGKYLVIGEDLDQQEQFVLFFEVFQTAVIYFFPHSDLPFQLLNTAYEELLQFTVSVDDVSVVADELLIF
jgi:hypothetical protein